MIPSYSLHPAIGLARVGDSPDQFYLAPERTGALPIACDEKGNTTVGPDGQEATTTQFKDAEGRILRQGARFQVFVYDDDHPQGRALEIGDDVQGVEGHGKLVDIHWCVYLANKKASWYAYKELEGEHGYASDHPLRNASVTGDARQSLIVDPGPRTVNVTSTRAAEFGAGGGATFPPPLQPKSIDTLGSLKTDDAGRLVVLGGHGNSGSYLTGLGRPGIQHYANNDGWFDDVSDGPVTAILEYRDVEDDENRFVQVRDSSWVIVGNPAYAPQIVNMITLDDLLYDLSVREFAYDTYLYGTDFEDKVVLDPTDAGALERWRAADKRWNPDYRPYFYAEIWPILLRPYNAQWVTNFLAISHDAHEIGPGGDFEEEKVSKPPRDGSDPYRAMRMFVYDALRQPGEEDLLDNTRSDRSTRNYGKPMMPLLCGDNPLKNTLPSKFLTLTQTQLFLLRQWAEGKFVNEKDEDIAAAPGGPVPPGVALDRGVLGNALGGSFCPGGEVGWIVRNPAIYSRPYRFRWNSSFLPTAGAGRGGMAGAGTTGLGEFVPPNALGQGDDFTAGLEPGDVTKRSALPWQADFNECSTQEIDVTFPEWNELFTGQADPQLERANRRVNVTLWWPTHRPMQVYRTPANHDPTQPRSYSQVEWATGIPQTNAGDLEMVTAWARLGFLIENPYDPSPAYIEIDEED